MFAKQSHMPLPSNMVTSVTVGTKLLPIVHGCIVGLQLHERGRAPDHWNPSHECDPSITVNWSCTVCFGEAPIVKVSLPPLMSSVYFSRLSAMLRALPPCGAQVTD